MGFWRLLRGSAKQKSTNISMNEFRIATALREEQIAEGSASASASTTRAKPGPKPVNKKSVDALLTSRSSYYSAALAAETQTADGSSTSEIEILPDDGNDPSQSLSYSGVTLADDLTADNISTTPPTDSDDSDSVLSWVIIDDGYIGRHGLVAPDKAHTVLVAPSSYALLPKLKCVDQDSDEAEGAAKDLKVVAEDVGKAAMKNDADGKPRLSGNTSTLDDKHVKEGDIFRPADANTNSEPPNEASTEPLEFDDEGIPLKEDADTFIIPMQNYPSERNGTLKEELAAAIVTPTTTAVWAGGAAKRMAEDVLAPSTLKRTFGEVRGTVTDGIVHYLNAVTAGYDVPEIAGRVIEPIVNTKDKIPTQEETDKLVDQAIDRIQALFKVHKMRRSTKTDTLNASGMAHMDDAHRVFGHEMCLEALQALVDDGIINKWQVDGDRRVLECRHRLEQALAKFYLQHRQNMQPEELMNAGPSWFVDREDCCFKLSLSVTWKVHGDPDVESRNKFLATNFALPEELCKMSIASICSETSPMAKEEDDGEPDDEPEAGDAVLQNVQDRDQTDENEDDGVIWLDEDDNEGNSE